MVQPGDCIHIKTGYNPDGSPAFHRFVVLTEPHPVWGVVLVNFSTLRQRRGEDTTVVFRAEELEFLIKDSYVVYEEALLLTINEISAKIELQEARKDGNAVELVIVERILEGVIRSRRTPIQVEEVCREFIERRGK